MGAGHAVRERCVVGTVFPRARALLARAPGNDCQSTWQRLPEHLATIARARRGGRRLPGSSGGCSQVHGPYRSWHALWEGLNVTMGCPWPAVVHPPGERSPRHRRPLALGAARRPSQRSESVPFRAHVEVNFRLALRRLRRSKLRPMIPDLIGPLRVYATGGSDRRGGGDGPAVLLCHGFGARTRGIGLAWLSLLRFAGVLAPSSPWRAALSLFWTLSGGELS